MFVVKCFRALFFRLRLLEIALCHGAVLYRLVNGALRQHLKKQSFLCTQTLNIYMLVIYGHTWEFLSLLFSTFFPSIHQRNSLKYAVVGIAAVLSVCGQ